MNEALTMFTLRKLEGDYCAYFCVCDWYFWVCVEVPPFFISSRLSKVWYYTLVRDRILLQIIGEETTIKSSLNKLWDLFSFIYEKYSAGEGISTYHQGQRLLNCCSAVLMEWPLFNSWKNVSWYANLLDRNKKVDKRLRQVS